MRKRRGDERQDIASSGTARECHLKFLPSTLGDFGCAHRADPDLGADDQASEVWRVAGDVAPDVYRLGIALARAQAPVHTIVARLDITGRVLQNVFLQASLTLGLILM
jgi:hypothetical protein